MGLTIGTRESTDVLVMFESSSLDPAFRELKYYSPGVGLIRAEEGVDENFANPTLVHNLVSPAPVPLPAAFPLLVAGLWLAWRLAPYKAAPRCGAACLTDDFGISMACKVTMWPGMAGCSPLIPGFHRICASLRFWSRARCH